MDGGDITETDHAHALRSLNRLGRLLGTDRQLSRCLARFGDDPSVLDLGCGGCGFLAHLARRRNSDGRTLLIGLDRSRFALKCAIAWHSPTIAWMSADARKIPLADSSIDVVTCSLFLHHFDAEEVVAILREAARVARRGIVFSDLARSPLAWILTWIMTRLLSRSWIVHIDGPRSVRAAYRKNELADLARAAGLKDAAVQPRFPFRLILSWQKMRADRPLRRVEARNDWAIQDSNL